jgi:transmembrane sensor
MDPIDIELLDRYFAGACTPDEVATVEAWVARHPDNARLLGALRAQFGLSAEVLPKSDANAVWNRIAERMAATPADSSSRTAIPLTLVRRSDKGARVWKQPAYGAWAVAAALIVAVGLGAWWKLAPKHRMVVQAPQEREYRTARGQRAMVRLSDGSEVHLNAESRLVIPAAFGSASREVNLEGEAFFNVVHDSTRAFIVRTPQGLARDVGTKFNVRAYPNDRVKQLQVVVAEGVVAIGDTARRDSVVLRAAEAGRVSESGELRVEHGVDVRARIGWMEGRLEFKNARLGEVLPALSRWYDAEVRVADGDPELEEFAITVSLTGDRFDDAIDVVARTVGARVVKRDSVFVLVKK